EQWEEVAPSLDDLLGAVGHLDGLDLEDLRREAERRGRGRGRGHRGPPCGPQTRGGRSLRKMNCSQFSVAIFAILRAMLGGWITPPSAGTCPCRVPCPFCARAAIAT